MRKQVFVLLLPILILASVNTSLSVENTAPSVRTINVDITGFAFDPSTITLEPGESVTFKITNFDAFPHTFTVDGVVLADLQGGDSATVSYTAPTTEGTLPITCNYHSSMSADLVVQAPTTTTSVTNTTTTNTTTSVITNTTTSVVTNTTTSIVTNTTTSIVTNTTTSVTTSTSSSVPVNSSSTIITSSGTETTSSVVETTSPTQDTTQENSSFPLLYLSFLILPFIIRKKLKND